MREWSRNNIVIISEKEAPSDFISIWKKEYNTATANFLDGNILSNKRKIYQEQLFIHEKFYLRWLI